MKYQRQSSTSRGYTWQWNKARTAYLKENPLCVYCLALGRDTRAEVVDHIKPHRGDKVLFWDVNNWQSLCKHCHDSHKHTLEQSGYLKGNDVNGMPLDPNHHWNG